MIREADLVDYLPPFMQTYKEPAAALEAEQPEFQLVWEAADKILYNRFISTADEYGISRFEKILGIYPSGEDTIESRRFRVQSRWFTKIPYTWRVLLEKLLVLCGDTDFVLANNFKEGYTLTLATGLEMYGQVEELEYIINTIIPENIVVDSKNSIPCSIKGAVFFGGGVCFINSFTVTNNFREIFDIDGTAAFGGVVSDTQMVTVTQGFSENFGEDSNADIAPGAVHADFIETNTK